MADVEPDLNTNLCWARTLLDELARAGVRRLCLCPGLRSMPLVTAVGDDPRFEVDVFIDERAAGFFALGVGRASGLPAAVITTSGSAVANLLPAAVEADAARVPLLLVSADRPGRLRDCGAPQTVDQPALLAGVARCVEQLPEPSPEELALAELRTRVARVVGLACGRPAGPAHVNVPFDLPLEPVAIRADARLAAPTLPRVGLEEGEPWLAVSPRGALQPAPATIERVRELVRFEHRGLIVVGPGALAAGERVEELRDAVRALAERSGYPVIADALSGLRYGEFGPSTVGAADAIFSHEPAASFLNPRLVIRLGGPTVAKGLNRWLEQGALDGSCRQLVVDGDGRYRCPERSVGELIAADAAAFCRLLDAALAADGNPTRSPLSGLYANAEAAVRRATAEVLERTWFEGKVAAELVRLLPAEATLVVASSKPVRELDWFGAPREAPLRTFGGRGANGIDGTIAHAFGAASVGPGPAVLLTGDLAFLHGIGGLWAGRQHRRDLTIVVVNDDGGRIFELLPAAAHRAHWEERVACRHGLDLEHACRLYGVEYKRARDHGSFEDALTGSLGKSGVRVIEVPLDWRENSARHREWRAGVEAALAGWLARRSTSRIPSMKDLR